MLEDVPTTEMPARSRLYSLPLMGTCGATMESLLDYAQRLSVAHCVKVRDLFAVVILPEANLQGAFFIPGYFSPHAVRGCSGCSRYAFAFLAAMERLTGRHDLADGTLTRWAPLVSDRGYVAKARRWCRQCLREQFEQGTFSYSLLWAFESVRICPIHGVSLAETCARCESGQPVIGDALIRGVCSACSTPLFENVSKKRKPGAPSRDLFVASAVAGMIEAGERAAELAKVGLYRQRLQEVADRVSGGSLHKLEQQLNLSDGTLRTQRRHSLHMLLEIMYRLGVQPVPFLEGSTMAEPRAHATSTPYRSVKRRSASELTQLREDVRVRLARALSDDTRLTTRLEFVRDLGIANSAFEATFGDAVKTLSAHNKRIRPEVHRELWRQREALIQVAMQSLVEGDGPFSSQFVEKALVKIGLHRLNPRVRQLANDALAQAITVCAGRDMSASQPTGNRDA